MPAQLPRTDFGFPIQVGCLPIPRNGFSVAAASRVTSLLGDVPLSSGRATLIEQSPGDGIDEAE